MEFAEVRDGLKEKSFVLVDVRNPEELQAAGKIPGSVNVPREFPELRLCHQFIFIVYLTLNLLNNYFLHVCYIKFKSLSRLLFEQK